MNFETIEEKNNSYNHPLYYSKKTSLNDEKEYDCFRLLLIEHGSGSICFEETSISFTTPTLVCINEKDVPKFKDCSDSKIKSIYFYPYLINPLFNYENIRDTNNKFSIVEQQDIYLLLPFIYRDNYYKGQFSIEPSTVSRVTNLIDFIRRELEQREAYWPCRSRSYLLELLILTTKLFDSNQSLYKNDLHFIPDNVATIITYLHNNYKEKITLEQLATMFNTNRTSINTEFYKATNLSIIDYLIKLRVNLAETMLRDTLIPISEIMNRVGFNDSSHFWRTFKKYTSLSPKEYRETYCWVKD